MFGDFEDLESGEKFAGDESDSENEVENSNSVDPEDEEEEDEKTKKQKIWEKKQKLKEAFNREYDDKGDPTAGFFEEWKRETEEIANRNKSEFADLPAETRIAYEGFRAGMYLRVELDKIPAELLNNMEIKYPMIIGGLLPSEQQRGTLQLRIKRHRWFNRPVLKSRDPLIFSLGWRRFQTMPVYYMQDHNMRQRFLKGKI